MDFVWALTKAPPFPQMKLFPNSKEISESMAIWEAYRKFLAKDCAGLILTSPLDSEF
jgi:hypothetical protein